MTLVWTRLSPNAHCRSVRKRSNVVGLLDTGFGMPDNVMTVSKDEGTQSRTIVSSNAKLRPVRQEISKSKEKNEYDKPSFGHSTLGLKFVFLYGGFDSEMSIRDGNLRTAVGKLGRDMFVRVNCVLRLNSDSMRTTNCGWMDGG